MSLYSCPCPFLAKCTLFNIANYNLVEAYNTPSTDSLERSGALQWTTARYSIGLACTSPQSKLESQCHWVMLNMVWPFIKQERRQESIGQFFSGCYWAPSSDYLKREVLAEDWKQLINLSTLTKTISNESAKIMWIFLNCNYKLKDNTKITIR